LLGGGERVEARDASRPDMLGSSLGMANGEHQKRHEGNENDDPFQPDEGPESLDLIAPRLGLVEEIRVFIDGDVLAVIHLDELPTAGGESVGTQPKDEQQTEPDEFDDWTGKNGLSAGFGIGNNYGSNDDKSEEGHDKWEPVGGIEEALERIDMTGNTKDNDGKYKEEALDL